MNKLRLIVVGAGPIGLETALRASHEGYDVTVLERGRIGEAIRGWGHVQLFTPFSMNSSERGRTAAGCVIPPDEIVTGTEFVDEYLTSLAACDQLQGRVREHHSVVSCSRQGYGKSDRIGTPNRNAAPFRILVDTPAGEAIFEAECLIDCTGFVSRHRYVGAGGIPCPGELSLLSDSDYSVPDIAGADRQRFANQHTLVIGSGYSAATSVCLLTDLMAECPETQVSWVTRTNRSTPLTVLPDDALQERQQLTSKANATVQGSSQTTWLAGALIQKISVTEGGFEVSLAWADENGDGQGRAERLMVDNIIANPGFRPDSRPFEELQIHRCYATDGPIKMAAHLLGESSGDCLTQSTGGVGLLKNPEPDFYILGAAAYGRDSRFLLQNGLQQMNELFEYLTLPAAKKTV